MKKKLLFPVLLLAAALLAGVLLIGRHGIRRADDAAVAENTPAPTQSVELPQAVETKKEEPSPTPAPTPEPTPEPTPKPLREPELRESELDMDLFLPAEHQGTVSLVKYITRDYVSDEHYDIEKDLAVYLPYGYDESEQYDVLILLHCAWADHRFWLAQEREYRTAEGILYVSVPNMLDRMIEEGW